MESVVKGASNAVLKSRKAIVRRKWGVGRPGGGGLVSADFVGKDRGSKKTSGKRGKFNGDTDGGQVLGIGRIYGVYESKHGRPDMGFQCAGRERQGWQ